MFLSRIQKVVKILLNRVPVAELVSIVCIGTALILVHWINRGSLCVEKTKPGTSGASPSRFHAYCALCAFNLLEDPFFLVQNPRFPINVFKECPWVTTVAGGSSKHYNISPSNELPGAENEVFCITCKNWCWLSCLCYFTHQLDINNKAEMYWWKNHTVFFAVAERWRPLSRHQIAWAILLAWFKLVYWIPQSNTLIQGNLVMWMHY